MAFLFSILLILSILFLSGKKANAETDHYDSSYLPPRAQEKFFIYDWPVCLRLICNRLDFGAGRLVNSDNGIYNTDQFYLFSLMYSRLLSDPRRTFQPEEATTFIIPYDLYADSVTVPKPNGKKAVSYAEGRSNLAPDVLTFLRASPYFRKSNGADHLLFVGWPYAIDQLILRPKAIALIALCENCTKLTIENYSFLYSSAKEKSLSQELKKDNWFAVPYPSNFHFSSTVKAPLLFESTQARPLLVSFIGTPWCSSDISVHLRKDLVHYCTKHGPEVCYHAHYSKHGNRGTDLTEDVHLQYSWKSIFCLEPSGDTTTRKGLFDAIQYGCIPVVFHPLSASAMYTWHWSSELWKDIVIEIPINMLADKSQPMLLSDPIQYLKETAEKDPAGIEKRQKLLRRHAFKLSYALEFYDYQNDASSAWPRDEEGNPLRDAYDITMDHVLGMHAKRWTPKVIVEVGELWRREVESMLPNYYRDEFIEVLEAFKHEYSVSVEEIRDGSYD